MIGSKKNWSTILNFNQVVTNAIRISLTGIKSHKNECNVHCNLHGYTIKTHTDCLFFVLRIKVINFNSRIKS